MLAGSLLAMPKAGAIEIVIKGLRSDKGFVGASLFSSENASAFPGGADKAVATRYVKIENRDEVRLVLEDIPHGTYSVSVIHDEDGDGKVGMLLGIPKEGFGFSNNPTIFFGPPAFKKASFDFASDKAVAEIKMKYLL